MPDYHRRRQRLGLVILTFILLNFVGFFAKAADAPICIQGSEKKTQIHDLISAQAPDVNGGLAGYYQLSKESTISRAVASLRDLPANCLPHKETLNELFSQEAQIQNIASHYRIKHECFVAAMKRNHFNEEYFCPSSSTKNPNKSGKNPNAAVDLGKPGDSGECVSTTMVDYVEYAFHEAISCLSDPQKPIDPVTIFAMMNNESAFHFYVAYSGGVGVGQLTTDAINAVNKHPGAPDYLEQVRNSKNPHCAPFKKALSEPLKNSYDNDHCPLLQPSEGFARSLIYSISYFLMTRDYLMKDVINFFNDAGEGRAPFFNYSALVMYGPKALKEQANVIAAYKASKQNFNKFRDLLDKKASYGKDTIDKADEVIKSSDTGPDIKRLGDCLEFND